VVSASSKPAASSASLVIARHETSCVTGGGGFGVKGSSTGTEWSPQKSTTGAAGVGAGAGGTEGGLLNACCGGSGLTWMGGTGAGLAYAGGRGLAYV